MYGCQISPRLKETPILSLSSVSRFRIYEFRNIDARRRVPVTDALRQGFRGIPDTVLTQRPKGHTDCHSRHPVVPPQKCGQRRRRSPVDGQLERMKVVNARAVIRSHGGHGLRRSRIM
jgi:hypothetical protein